MITKNLMGYVPLDANGQPILGGTVRFKAYKTPAYALAQPGAVGFVPVYYGEPE